MQPDKNKTYPGVTRGPRAEPRRTGDLRISDLNASTRDELKAQLRVRGICDSILLKLNTLKTQPAPENSEGVRD